MKQGTNKPFPATALTRTDSAPVDNLISTYVARRELVPVLVEHLLVPAGLTFEEAELMLELFGPWKLGWKVPACDSEGYVIQKALEKALVNSQPHVSRRVGQIRFLGQHLRRCQDRMKVPLSPISVDDGGTSRRIKNQPGILVDEQVNLVRIKQQVTNFGMAGCVCQKMLLKGSM